MAVGASGYLYKPAGENSGRPVVITPGRPQKVELIDSNGNVTATGNYRHPYSNGGSIFDLPHGNGTQVRVTAANGQVSLYAGGGSQRSGGGPISGGGSSSNQSIQVPVDENGDPVKAVDGVAVPLPPGQFPSFPTISFPSISTKPIKKADYNFTDPIEFASSFGDFNRGEINKNFTQASDFASKALTNELEGLKAFVPAAAALSRSETSVDNQFNQAARTAQVDATLPGARGTYAGLDSALTAQGKRAATYASGRLTDPALDRALELGIRSGAADTAGYSGIGPRSLQAQKISDLQSAEQRFQIAQYGEQLTGQNVQAQEGLVREQANLFLAPTSYSQIGQQVRPVPEVGAGRLTYQGLGALNEATLVTPGQALSSTIQQEQFGTTLEQRTNEFNSDLDLKTKTFNAEGQFAADKFNSTGIFSAALGQFSTEEQFKDQIQQFNQGVLNNELGAGLSASQGANFAAGQDNAAITSILQAIGGSSGASGGLTSILGDLGLIDLPKTNSGGDKVSGGQADTAPSSSSSGSGIDTRGSAASDAYQLDSGFYANPPRGATAEGSSPATYSFPAGAPLPQGYAPISQNADGSTSAVNTSDYSADLDRFSRSRGLTANIDTASAAQMDKAITTSAALSYVPIQGFQQIGLSSSGRAVYSLPAAAQSGDTTIGQNKIVNAGLAAAHLGVDDPAAYDALMRMGDAPNNLASFDQVYGQRGEQALAEAIEGVVTGGRPADLDTKAGQQIAFGASRIADLWPGLSPGQKSLALSAMTAQAVEHQTGKKLSDHVVPGTASSVGGSLKVGDVIDVTSKGQNGFALARNWNQLSALGAFTGKVDPKNPSQVARFADAIGFLGYGPQGAAVKVDAKYLKNIGAVSVPEFGVGAATFNRANHVPENYKVVTQTPDGKVIALPKNLVSTSPLSGAQALGYHKVTEIAEGRHPAQKLWSEAPTRGVPRGAVGGSAIIAGLSSLLERNPYLAASVTAYSLFNNQVGA